jgi:hypothetical protein
VNLDYNVLVILLIANFPNWAKAQFILQSLVDNSSELQHLFRNQWKRKIDMYQF